MRCGWLMGLWFSSIVSLWSIPVSVSASVAATSPLLDRLQQLHCATNVTTATQALKALWGISSPDDLFPNEWHREWQSNKTIPPRLSAASLDIALNTLVETSHKYPSLRHDIERTMLQWNYCDVFDNKKFYDLAHIVNDSQKRATNLRRDSFKINSLQ